MVWQQWVLIAWYVLGILFAIRQIDRPREPIDGPTGAAMVGLYALVIWMVASI